MAHINFKELQLSNAAVLSTPGVRDSLERNDYKSNYCNLLRCVKCGRTKISGSIVKWSNFSANLLCYDCQKFHLMKPRPEANKQILNIAEPITPKQKELLCSLIRERFTDDDMTQRLDGLSEMTKTEASNTIKELINGSSVPF